MPNQMRVPLPCRLDQGLHGVGTPEGSELTGGTGIRKGNQVKGSDSPRLHAFDQPQEILNGPMEVPGPMWIANCMDPQGAAFSLVAPKR